MDSNQSDSEARSMVIGKDIPWGETRGHGFRVKNFTPLASIEKDEIKEPRQILPDTPYALLEVECPFSRYGDAKILLSIAHSLDFRHCWELYKERGIEPEEEVIVSYSPPEGKVYRLFGKTFPHLHIEVRRKGSLEEMYELGRDDGLQGMDVLRSTRPDVMWDPSTGRIDEWSG